MRKSLDHLNGIRDSRFRYSCAICREPRFLQYPKNEQRYITITTCCDSLTCVRCAEKDGVVHRCSVCLKETQIGLQPKSWLGFSDARQDFASPYGRNMHNFDYEIVNKVASHG